MKLEIWCQKSFGIGGTPGVLARVGEWPVVPTVGEYIIVWDGWCSEKVLNVHHSFYDNTCYIEIGPDYNGEYARQGLQKNDRKMEKRISTMERLLEGFQIFLQYDEENGGCNYDHGEIFAGNVRPEDLVPRHVEKLKELGWSWSDGSKCWRHF